MPPATDLRAVGLLERAIGYTRRCLALVDEPLLERPTPCTEWDLRALLEHLDESLSTFAEATARGRIDTVPTPTPSGLPARLLVRRLQRGASAALGGWAAGAPPRLTVVGAGPLDGGVVAAVGALEVAVHGWDVAQACGGGVPLPEALAADLLDLAPALVDDADRPSRFGPARSCPGGASVGSPADRLLGLLGRTPPGGGSRALGA